MVVGGRRPLSEANEFAGAAAVYWFEVFPYVKRQTRRWAQRARRIPDPTLRRIALDTQTHERGNLEGSAVFAMLAPRPLRGQVVRAVVAFQALYDYLDTLAELPVADPVANGYSLHLALLAALDPGRPRERYFEHSGFGGDSGYTEDLLRVCRTSLIALPGWEAMLGPAVQAAARMSDYQSFNHDPGDGSHAGLRSWAGTLTPPGSGLEWWETAAGAASSLVVFALIALAAQGIPSEEEARATAAAYFPWVGALHVLLDSLVDHERDFHTGDHSLVSHYFAPERAAERLAAIANEATLRLAGLAQSARHALILSAMAGFYLCKPAAEAPIAFQARARVLSALGPATGPAMRILRTRARFSS